MTRGAGIVLLTHDIGLARSRGRRVVVLYRGEIVEELPGGRVDEAVLPHTRGLMDSAVRLGDPPRSRKSIAGHAVPLQTVPEGCGYGDRCPWVEESCTRERPVLVGTGSHKARCRRATALETTGAGLAH